jgi:acetyltransferase
MSVRNLSCLFRPKAIALIGASTREHAVGAVMTQNLLRGGFAGPVLLVNPSHKTIGEMPCYPDVASLPTVPDLAAICTPAEAVPKLVAELGARGTKGAVVVSAGFKELGSKEGQALQQAMLDAARPHLLRIIGPNGIGMLSTPAGVNASFAHIAPIKGNIAFVAQSGAMLTTILDWATARAIGFSHLVSLGDMADVDFGDMLDYLASDEATHSILLYIEAITEARKFMSAARAAARTKPVIVIKAGRHAAAAKAAQSHTGALAGADAVYDAAFRRAGLLRVGSLDELFDAVETLATARVPHGDRLAILTNGGGLGVLATDALLDRSGVLAELSAATITKLNAVLPPTWSHGNPIDIIGDASPKRYDDSLVCLLDAPEVDAVLVLNCPVAIASGVDAARAVAARALQSRKTLLTSWVGDLAAKEPRRYLARTKVATYDTPDKAIDGYMHLVRYQQGQRQLLEVPPSMPSDFTADLPKARQVVDAAFAAGTQWLGEIEIGKILAAYGLEMARTRLCATADDAAAAADQLGGSVALKIHSPDITHKSDVGGIALGLRSADAVRKAAQDMRERVTQRAPKAQLAGFLVQEMIQRPDAHELIAGMTVDPLFGPVLLFGRGGTAVEVIKDNALGLAPLNLALAREMITRTRVYQELRGYRDRKPADIDAIALALVKLSQLACDLDEIQEFEINPLLADERGLIALDARARIAPVAAGTARGARLSIRPYPREFERTENIPGFGSILLRPIRPEDALALNEFFDRLTAQDVRMRFFAPIREIPTNLRARLTQIDYDREMAFVLVAGQSMLGGARLIADPDNDRAEFSIAVRSDLKGKGLGWMLMHRLVEYARNRGTGALFGDMLSDNKAMIKMCRELGFVFLPTGDATVVRAELNLTGVTTPIDPAQGRYAAQAAFSALEKT